MPVTIIARSVHGLEWVCAAEIAENFDVVDGVRMDRREVVFELPDVRPGLLELRCADDTFLYVGEVGGVGTTKDTLPIVVRRLAGLDWAAALARIRGIRDVPDQPAFDCVVSLEGRRSYNRFLAESQAGTTLARHLGGVFLARDNTGGLAGTPDLTVRLFFRSTGVIAALRLGLRPLHRRDYKTSTGAGTLHPPMAAALAALAGPLDNRTTLDPFCGDGTIPIETAIRYPSAQVLGSDIDPDRVANAQANAERARVRLSVSLADAGNLAREPASVDAVVTNPPWNVAVDSRGSLDASLEQFWRTVPAVLRPGGLVCSINDADLDVPARLARWGYHTGLQTQVRLAGRLVHLVLAGPPDGMEPRLGPTLEAWHERAIRAGVVTDSGF